MIAVHEIKREPQTNLDNSLNNFKVTKEDFDENPTNTIEYLPFICDESLFQSTSQGIRIDLNKRSGPKQKTITAWKGTPYRYITAKF